MTQKEIAQQLGISVSTVSRVLNDIPKACSAELKDKIWQLARASDYQFNTAARRLKKGLNSSDKNKTKINFISFWEKSTIENRNTFYDNVLNGIQKESLENNYLLNCLNYSDCPHSPNEFFESLSKFDPFIILGRVPSELLKSLNVRHLPHVQIALNTNCDKIDNVLCNGYAAAENAVKFLHWCGHRYIIYVGKRNNEIRYYGFSNQLTNLNLPKNELSCITTDLTVAGGYRAAEIFIKLRKRNEFHKRVSAVFTANDNIAIGMYSRFQEENLKIPQDISIISVDDIQESATLSPRLTTMSIPQEEMGTVAVQIISLRLMNKLHLPLKIELPFSLELRDSVADLKNHSRKETLKFIHHNLT